MLTLAAGSRTEKFSFFYLEIWPDVALGFDSSMSPPLLIVKKEVKWVCQIPSCCATFELPVWIWLKSLHVRFPPWEFISEKTLYGSEQRETNPFFDPAMKFTHDVYHWLQLSMWSDILWFSSFLVPFHLLGWRPCCCWWRVLSGTMSLSWYFTTFRTNCDFCFKLTKIVRVTHGTTEAGSKINI